MEMVDIVLGETRANQSPSVGLLASSGGPATMCDGVRQTKSASKGSLAGRGDTELTGNQEENIQTSSVIPPAS